MQSDLVKALKIDKSSIQRRVAAALDRGVLRNLEDKKGPAVSARSWESRCPTKWRFSRCRSGCSDCTQ